MFFLNLIITVYYHGIQEAEHCLDYFDACEYYKKRVDD